MPSTIVPTTPQHSRPSSTMMNVQTTPKSSGRHQQQQQQLQQRRQRKAQSMSPQSQIAYASSSSCSSPSARNVPMPPTEWLNQLSVPSCSSSLSRPSSSISNGSFSSSPASSNLSSPSPSPSSSPLDLFGGAQKADQGVRVCPLQLIAAVASA